MMMMYFTVTIMIKLHKTIDSTPSKSACEGSEVKVEEKT